MRKDVILVYRKYDDYFTIELFFFAAILNTLEI